MEQDATFLINSRVQYSMKYCNGAAIIDRLFVEKEHRGKGLATHFLKQICFVADSENYILLITPSNFQGSNVNRLIKFYKRFGFVKRKGLFELPTSAMMRLPKKQNK